MCIESVMPSSHLTLCRPVLLLPSVFPRSLFSCGLLTLKLLSASRVSHRFLPHVVHVHCTCIVGAQSVSAKCRKHTHTAREWHKIVTCAVVQEITGVLTLGPPTSSGPAEAACCSFVDLGLLRLDNSFPSGSQSLIYNVTYSPEWYPFTSATF